jgi:hypothetical protein
MRSSTRQLAHMRTKPRAQFMICIGLLLGCHCFATGSWAEELAEDLAEDLAAQPEPLNLRGSWYVLVHYRESTQESIQEPTTASPDDSRWEDKIWTFEPKGSRLVWTEYSAVVFDDERGRHEKLASGRLIQSSGTWQPSPRQLAQVKTGLSVDSHSAHGKSLTGDPRQGYRSAGRTNRESASVIGYSEAWEIRGLAALPMFQRTDEMTSGRSVALSGRTEYRSTAVSADGQRISGSFTRDRDQTGTFSMIRSGQIEFAKPKEDEKWK